MTPQPRADSPVTYRMLGVESNTPDEAVKCNCKWDAGHEPTCLIVLAHEFLKLQASQPRADDWPYPPNEPTISIGKLNAIANVASINLKAMNSKAAPQPRSDVKGGDAAPQRCEARILMEGK